MVRSELCIDGDSLREAARHIRDVVDSFATAGSDAHDAASHVGHGGLASRVNEFADGWEIHRGKFGDELRHMADMLESVEETFTDLDNHTAEKVRQATAAALAPFSPTGFHGTVPAPLGVRDS